MIHRLSSNDELKSTLRNSRISLRDAELVGTLILSRRAPEVARMLFRMLEKEPIEIVIANLLSLFRELSQRDARWARILRKSVFRRGRCPKPLRKAVRDLLVVEQTRLASEAKTAEEVVTALEQRVDRIQEDTEPVEISFSEVKSFLRKSKRKATLRISTELTNLKNMAHMISALDHCTPPPEQLYFDFQNVTHLYVPGLVALAAWANRWKVNPTIVNTTPRTHNYLAKMGFFEQAAHLIEPYYEPDPIYQMGIENLASGVSPDEIADRLVRIIRAQIVLLRPRDESALSILLSELVENIHRHAGSVSGAYAAAQVYPKNKKLTISVVDSGMGIRDSFLKGQNEEIKRRLKRRDSHLMMACAPLVTSKPNEHSGYGLYVTSELVTRNGGTFQIASGSELYTRYISGLRRIDRIQAVSGLWHGTWIALIIDLNRTLSALDVYKSLPAAPGAEYEDYFAEEE